MLLLKEFDDGKPVRERRVILDDRSKPITFGRGSESTYSFFEQTPQLSRLQATLTHDGENWILHSGKPRGLQSANGVYFQGRRIDAPIKLVKGAVIVLFQNGSNQVILEYRESLQETYTGEADLAGAIAALRQDLARLISRAEERDRQIERILSEPIEKLQSEFDQRMVLLSQGMSEFTEAIAQSNSQDIEHEQKLKAHDHLIRRVGLSMAAALLSLGGWNLTNGNKDAVTQSINILFAFVGGTGGTYLLQKEAEKAAAKDSPKPV